jgi:DNA repair photolyase
VSPTEHDATPVRIRRPAPRAVEVREIPARTVLTKQGPRSFTLNPYRGCPVSCAYCYVPRLSYMRQEERPWGSYVDVKRDVAERLEVELTRLKEPSVVMMSTATDPYVPQEAEFRITRSVLEVFARHPRHRMTILTKTTLYLDDLDLLGRIEALSLGCSVSTFSDALAARIEPWGALPSERLDALGTAARTGINTFVLWAPMLVPAAATSADYGRLLSGIRERRIGRVRTDRANYRGTFPPALTTLVARGGERFATTHDEHLVASICETLGFDGAIAAPAGPTVSEQLSLFA